MCEDFFKFYNYNHQDATIFYYLFLKGCTCFGRFLRPPLGALNCTFSVDKKNQLDVTFCILYFSSNSCSTCFGQPCAHHQELMTA